METTLTPNSADEYLIIVEAGSRNYSAYAPDLPGCVSTGDTVEECEQSMREAIAFHLDGMREDGDPIPPPTIAAAAFVPAA
jgi:predicted RNase H-like HicB family nuclease